MHATLSSLALTLPAIAMLLLSVVLFFSTRFFFSFIRSHLLAPWSSRKALVSQGFHVLPYRPIAGDLPQFNRFQTIAQLSPLPSPSHHHLLFPYLYPFFHHHFSKHGDDVAAPLVFWWGNHPFVVITHPDDVKCAMMADVKRFDRSQITRLFRPLLGNGLLISDGNQWQRHRSIMRPAFFADNLKNMVGHMTASAMDMVKDWERQVAMAGGGSVEMEVAKPIKDTTADILSRTLFGSSYLQGKAVFEAQVELLQLILRCRVPLSTIPGYRFLPTRDNRRAVALEKKIHMELLKLVESRLNYEHHHPQQNEEEEEGGGGSTTCTCTGGGGEPDILGLMVAAETEDAACSNVIIKSESAIKRIVDECKTFFFAGHEATAALLAWTMMLLSLHPEWQERARREVLDVFRFCGPSSSTDSQMLQAANALSRLKIMGMVLNETLRLYPPTPEYGKRVTNSAEKAFMLGSRALPSGTNIVVECLYIHRRKDIWGEDADEFNPERFSEGVGNACKHPYGFIPFGMGSRHCIGQNFAMLGAKVILAHILKHFKFRLSPTYVHAPVVALTMRPKHGLHLILDPL